MKIKRLVQIILALVNCLEGYIFKFKVDIGIIKPIPLANENCDNVIVSLTSFGRRVQKNIVYYTIISILQQKVRPDKIVLWIDELKWNEDNLPKKLRSLRKYGVEISYCEDVRSYTKLVPSLIKYPQSTIITVDDDLIYPDNTLEQLITEHKNYPNDIICLYAKEPIMTNGVPLNYKEWKILNESESGKLIFPIGAAGVLYPPRCLHPDTCNKELFIKLSPLADDIWFWFCGLRNNTNKIFIPRKDVSISFYMLYQYLNQGSSLTHANKHQGKNDEQLKNILMYYGVTINNDGTICKNI